MILCFSIAFLPGINIIDIPLSGGVEFDCLIGMMFATVGLLSPIGFSIHWGFLPKLIVYSNGCHVISNSIIPSAFMPCHSTLRKWCPFLIFLLLPPPSFSFPPSPLLLFLLLCSFPLPLFEFCGLMDSYCLQWIIIHQYDYLFWCLEFPRFGCWDALQAGFCPIILWELCFFLAQGNLGSPCSLTALASAFI